jgi:DNA-directed RNA polymerase specialized sigma24 family protein
VKAPKPWSQISRKLRADIRRGLRAEVRRRLERWARWWQGDRELARASPFPAYNQAFIRGTGRSSIPGVFDPELEQTDRALETLTRRQYKALLLHYLKAAAPSWKAKECRLTLPTFYRVAYKASLLFLERCHASRKRRT